MTDNNIQGKVLSLFPKPHHPFPNLLLALFYATGIKKCPPSFRKNLSNIFTFINQYGKQSVLIYLRYIQHLSWRIAHPPTGTEEDAVELPKTSSTRSAFHIADRSERFAR